MRVSRKTLSGKGAQYNPRNQFSSTHIDWSEEEQHNREKKPVRVLKDNPASIINHNSSPDLFFNYSINPYQGCEHGCSYCYARVTHEYWGLSAGLDFETLIMVKQNAPELLRKKLYSRNWKGDLLMFSGNTDCYQPIEKKYGLTRQLLSICLEHRQVVNIITKNHLILRDMDLLSEMARLKLLSVCFSITTVDEQLRRKLEPRTSSSLKKFEAVEKLSKAGIPVSVNMAPVIPGLNEIEIPEIVKRSKLAGAYDVNYATVRLNGVTGEVFKDWLMTHYASRSEKVWHGIERLHGGEVSNSNYRMSMREKGAEASAISQLFKTVKAQHFKEVSAPEYDFTLFRRSTAPMLFN